MDANAHAAEPTPADPAAATSAPRKFSLDEALRHWSDPDDLTFVDELGLCSEDPVGGLTKTPVNEAYFERHREWNRRRKPLIEALMAKLRAGELTAFGIDSQPGVTSKREPIAAELWDLLKPGFKRSEATYGRLRITNIEIEAAPAERSDTEMHVDERPEFESDIGYRHVRIREHRFALSGKQCEAVQILHKASMTPEPWVDGCDLTEEAGYSSTFIGDAFRRHPNWNELIARDGRGAYKLNLKRSPGL